MNFDEHICMYIINVTDKPGQVLSAAIVLASGFDMPAHLRMRS